MMSADDETQIEELDVNNQNTNSKISESFGLTTPLATTNAPLKPSVTIATQSPANYFKPISTAPLSSSTLTTSISDVKQPIKLPDFSSSFSNTQRSTDSIDSSKSLQPANNLFMMPNLSAMPTSLISAPIALTTPTQNHVIQPPTATTSAPPLAPPKTMTNTLPPTIPQPSVFAPPSTQPPSAIPQSSASGSSNPYSARGALNKKIYDQNQLASVPVAAPASNILLPTLPNDQTAPTTNLYVPPPASVQQPSSSPTPQTTIQSPYQPLIQQQSTLPPPPSSAQIAAGGYSTPFIPPSQSGPPLVQPTMQRLPDPQDQSAFILSDQMSSMSFNYPQDNVPTNTSYNNRSQQKTPWNWLTQNKFINTLKTGVESLVTTIDPQMREYIHNTNEHLYIINTSVDKCVSEAIREAFNLIGYLRLSVYDYDCRTSNAYAPQIVGHACALQAIQEKLNNALQYVQQECIMIGVQDFVVELTQNSWFEHTCILLRDTKHNIEISVYTEGIPVPNELMQSVLQKTTDSYPLKWSGFASRIIEHSNMDWYDMVYGLQRKTFITNSLKTLAYIYKSKSNSSSS